MLDNVVDNNYGCIMHTRFGYDVVEFAMGGGPPQYCGIGSERKVGASYVYSYLLCKYQS